jgi:hypothetical protein
MSPAFSTKATAPVYGPPGAFAASIAWYRAGAGSVAASLAERAPDPAGRIAVPATVLWPEHDPLFPREWSDRIGEFFAAAQLTWLDCAGHFSPLEAAGAFAAPSSPRSGPARTDLSYTPPQGMGALDREAKKAETREARLAKTVESLHAGKRAR